MLPRDRVAIGIPAPAARDLEDVMPVPGVMVPASELLCHPSRLANVYEPEAERVRQRAFLIPGENVVATIRQGIAPPYDRQVPVGWRSRLAARLEALRRGPCFDLGERLAYDARPVFNGNMAHLVQHHLANLGYLRERLGHGPGDVAVILEARPAALAVQVFSLLGYEVVATDLAVQANLAHIAVGQFFHLLPWVRHLDIPGWVADTPARVFISRRDSRRLTNEAEIEARLRERGFEKVYFEDMAIVEQWSVLRNALQVVAIHGAALGCLAFQAARSDGRRARLVELFGAGFVVNPYRKFMAVLGGKWVGCRGRITPEVVRDIDAPGRAKAHAFDDFEVAGSVVDEALEFVGGLS
ncbi:MAG TPA: glycosyltransferase family 61 protein [Rhodocyclaceae bacterium]|nr:glycosyltransferase family 61 protein [Rhodocyclaceae bacterium]